MLPCRNIDAATLDPIPEVSRGNIMHNLKKLAVRGGALVLAASVPLSTMAQIEEIVVTAQRREASAQDTPIAINALSGDQLDEYGVIGADDLEQSFVGITTNNSGPGERRNIDSRRRHIELSRIDPTIGRRLHRQHLPDFGRSPARSLRSTWNVSRC